MYSGDPLRIQDLEKTRKLTAIFQISQIIDSEFDERSKCKNYPDDTYLSFVECDRENVYLKFLNDYKIMPFWATRNLQFVTNLT